MNNVQEAYIPVTGGKVWYEIKGSDKKGIPLLTLHGGPGANHEYLQPLEALADERPVIFYDQLGGGNSNSPDNKSLWTAERFVEELGQVTNFLNLKKVHLLGHSWGTMLAADYMLTGPDGVISVIFASPCLCAPRFIQDSRAYLSELPENIQRIIMESEQSGNFDSGEYQEAMMAFYKLHICRLDPWPELLNKSFEKLSYPVYGYMWGASEFTANGTLKDYDRVSKLKEIKVPSLFTCGRYDEATPEATKYYHNNLPGSEIVIFEESSHTPHIEEPEKYIETVRNFLRRAEK